MCGIVGYIGKENAVPILLEGLKKLEYRGYDSAGIAVMTDGVIAVRKKKGRIQQLHDLIDQEAGADNAGEHCGIGHTRWATHGEPSDINAHPHTNQSGTIAVVHNGIIENYMQLRERMGRRGFTCVSETDSEVIAHMLEYYGTGNPIETIRKVTDRLEGSYALAVLFKEYPNRIYCVRKDSPMVIGQAPDGFYIASDAPAILTHTRDVYYPEHGEIAEISESGILFFDEDAQTVEKETIHLELKEDAADKGNYEHFMMKEIQEQPQAIGMLLGHYLQEEGKEDMQKLRELLSTCSRLHIVACGSAYHAGMTGKYLIENLAGVAVEVELASEFRYRRPVLNEGEVVLVISQSGETADTVAALREAKVRGCRTMAIVNAQGSTIARESDLVLYTYAGPEISVATTKGYSTQLVVLDLIAVELASLKERITDAEKNKLHGELMQIPAKIRQILEHKEKLQRAANECAGKKQVFFIGRSLDYTLALEAALKLKEISYIHAEAYAAGELKHGTIALIEQDSLVVAIETQQELYDKIHSNIVEVQSRGAKIFAVGFEAAKKEKETLELEYRIPEIQPFFAPSLAIIPFQLFAYYISVAKGIDVDKPRNLAKSVTVE